MTVSMEVREAESKRKLGDLDSLHGVRVQGGIGVVETFEAGKCRHHPVHKGYDACVQASDMGHHYYRQTWLNLEACPYCRRTGFEALEALRVSLGDGEPLAHAVACPGCQRVMFTYEALWGRGEQTVASLAAERDQRAEVRAGPVA